MVTRTPVKKENTLGNHALLATPTFSLDVQQSMTIIVGRTW